MELNKLVEEVSDNAHKHGWIIKPGFNQPFAVPEALMLTVSELSEAMEDWRDGNIDMVIDPSGKPHGFPVELADAVIRLLHLSGDLEINLEEVLKAKMEYNKTRPYLHGRKIR